MSPRDRTCPPRNWPPQSFAPLGWASASMTASRGQPSLRLGEPNGVRQRPPTGCWHFLLPSLPGPLNPATVPDSPLPARPASPPGSHASELPLPCPPFTAGHSLHLSQPGRRAGVPAPTWLKGHLSLLGAKLDAAPGESQFENISGSGANDA